jgi:tetratricopeptide (TPR) repeat protein
MLLTSSAWVNLTLTRPSELVLPDYIKAIALIDRTLQEETPQNKVEQVITGEIFRQDEQAIMKVTDGFIDACSGMNRFQPVRTTEKYQSDGTKTTFPTPLDWNTVDEICSKYQADALLSIEIFDTDFLITNNPVKIDVKDDQGGVSTRVEFRASGVAVIHFGIRMYDAANRTILDEYQTSHRMNFDAQAGTLQAAVNQLLDKVEAINQASFDAGFLYGQRITPTYYRVTRYFFDKPKKELGAGVRYSEVADWQGAINAWMKVVERGERKDAGRAAYNIAVAYEVLGDLEEAKRWAARSHTEFAEKDADEYYKMLNNRIREEALVEQQLPE